MTEDNAFDHVAVLDFEATCDRRRSATEWDPSLQEIIEIPVGVVSVADRTIVATFDTFVRPIRQPELTPFCVELTSIRQEDVDGGPTIREALAKLSAFFEAHDLTPRNCLVATCGDWDLESMWPQQACLVDGLPTPALFRRWCKIKVVYTEHTGNAKTGMMGMLRAMDIEHVGHHHRGRDDVRNLCRLVIALLDDGATFRATWTGEDRARKRRVLTTRLETTLQALAEARCELADMPDRVPEIVRERLRREIERLEGEAHTHRAQRRVFRDPS